MAVQPIRRPVKFFNKKNCCRFNAANILRPTLFIPAKPQVYIFVATLVSISSVPTAEWQVGTSRK